MFLLAHTWDLASFLKNHALVSFIVEQHNLQRESLLRPAPSPEPIREESLQEFDDEFKSLLEKIDDAKLKEERQLVDLRCTRCERRIVTVSFSARSNRKLQFDVYSGVPHIAVLLYVSTADIPHTLACHLMPHCNIIASFDRCCPQHDACAAVACKQIKKATSWIPENLA